MTRKSPAQRSPAAPSAPALRDRAETELRAGAASLTGRPASELAPLVHELQIHQTELELQNEEVRRAQVELAHARDRYSDLYEFAPVGYLTLDHEGVIEQANLTAAAMLGCARGDLVGARFSRFLARASQDAFFLHARRALASAERQEVEVTLRKTPEGAGRTVEIQSVLRTESPASRTRWHAVLIDITRRKQAELELKRLNAKLEQRVAERTSALNRSGAAARASQHQLAGIVDSAMDAIISVDARQHIILFNPAAEHMFGWTATQARGQPLDMLIPERWRKGMDADLRRLARSRERNLQLGGAQPVTARRADGTEFPMEASLSRTPGPGRKGFTIILRDISRRVRAVENLLANEAALTDFFTAAPIGLMWVQPDGIVERTNLAQLAIMGRPSAEVVGHPLADFAADAEVVAWILAQMEQRKTVRDHRLRWRCGDGSMRHVLVDANAFWRGDQQAHSRWYVRDITQRLELEREILAIAEREQLRIGHELHDDFGQRLVAIEFMSETVANEWGAGAPQLAAAIHEISAAIRQVTDLARELARGLVAPIGAKNGELLVALRQLAERTRTLFRRECEFECKEPVEVTDPVVAVHLYRIAQEAVSNAIKHGKASRIDIQMTTRGTDLLLGIRDNGVGLPDPFPEGKGMGLRIMQYRAGTIAGSLVVQRDAGGGTSVVCTVKHALSRSPFPTAP